jgi:RluA family pseudouridine synthase
VQKTPPEDLRHAHVPARSHGQRLDRFLAEHFPLYSRKQLAQAVRAGLVRVNGRIARPGTTLRSGDALELPVWSRALPALAEERDDLRRRTRAETAVRVLHRDEDLLVVDKPAGMPTHGGAQVAPGATLVDALREAVLAGYGLVHRLDRDTTGAIALVRGEEARRRAAEAFAADGLVEKVYEALVSGVPDPAEGEVDLPLAPPARGGRARVDEAHGKPARTRYRVIEAFGRAARVEVEPLTGRTHQIRAHLAAIGHPLLVDPLYGERGACRIPDPRGRRDARLVRTPLHARRLVLPHPRTGERLAVEAPLPNDLRYAFEVLRVAAARGRKRGGLPPAAIEEAAPIEDALAIEGEPEGPQEEPAEGGPA